MSRNGNNLQNGLMLVAKVCLIGYCISCTPNLERREMLCMTRGVKTSSKGAMRRVRKWLRSVVDNRWLYVLVLPALIYLLVFNYLPMYGI